MLFFTVQFEVFTSFVDKQYMEFHHLHFICCNTSHAYIHFESLSSNTEMN